MWTVTAARWWVTPRAPVGSPGETGARSGTPSNGGGRTGGARIPPGAPDTDPGAPAAVGRTSLPGRTSLGAAVDLGPPEAEAGSIPATWIWGDASAAVWECAGIGIASTVTRAVSPHVRRRRIEAPSVDRCDALRSHEPPNVAGR